MRIFVRILNPAPGETPVTTPERAQKLVNQGRGTMIDGHLRLITDAEVGYEQRRRGDDAETRIFDRAVEVNVSTRVWRTEHSGAARMPGAPRLGVRQLVEIRAGSSRESTAA